MSTAIPYSPTLSTPSPNDAPGAAPVPERPSIRPGVELAGEMQDTGFVECQWLIQRDGRFLQVPELLYRVAEQLDGRHTLAEAAAAVTGCTDWIVNADHVRAIVAAKLIPLGLIAAGAESTPTRVEKRDRSALQIRLRVRTLSARVIDPIARVLQHLFAPVVLVPLLLLTGAAYVWLYAVRGVSESVRAALYMPGGLLLVFGLVLASGIVHEFGHAAALRYGGGRARGMGVGIYIVYPTFYTDTTDAYRLGRWARLRTDLGGIYFHLLFGLGIIGAYFATGQELLLAVVLVVTGDIAYQLLPFVRLDGYWALADLTGIPDPLSQTSPFLRGVVPPAGGGPVSLPRLRRGPAAAFIAYLALALPALVLLALLTVLGFPRFMTMGWDALLHQFGELAEAHGAHDALFVTAVVAQIVLLALSLIAMLYFVVSTAAKAGRALWRWSRPSPRRRVAGALAGATATASIAFLWFPALGAALTPSLTGVSVYEVESRRHVLTPVSYAQSPPVGGNHYPIWQNCGFYDTPVANEMAVHALEHGAVWITYRPALPNDQLRSLREAARRGYILVSPYPGLPAPVVASAWGRQARFDSAGAPALTRFIDAFRLGRQAPERGAECTGGIGTPVS